MDDDDDFTTWCSPRDCLWEGPQNMVTKMPLQHLYERILSEDQLLQLSNFFKQVLGITGASWSNVTAELEYLRDFGHLDFAQIFDFYQYLDKMTDINIIENLR